MTGEFRLKSLVFRRERQASWTELERLLRVVRLRGVRGLSRAELTRLPELYHGVVSSLSVARSISLDRALLDYLNDLACRAYVVVYGTKRRPIEVAWDFVARGFPRAVRRHRGVVVAASGSLLAGACVGYLMVSGDLQRYYDFMPEMMAQGRTPAASTESLREGLYAEESTIDTLHRFAAFLFQNNARVGIFCLSVGFLGGLPSLALGFYNGLILGAMTALFASRGLGSEFLAWVAPHGVPELFAIALCAAAGLSFGLAIVFPGEHTRLENLAIKGRGTATLALGAFCLLFVAALLEGLFRQLVHAEATRWTTAAVCAALFSAYFLFAGRRGEDA